MQIPVLIERIPGDRFRARSGEPLGLSADASTPQEAVAKLREQIDERLANGAQLIPLDVASEEHPLAKFAGIFKDDPLFKEVLEIMEENRKKADEDPDYL